jgi:hypothetical protein
MAKKRGADYEDLVAELLAGFFGVEEVGRRRKMRDRDGIEREFDLLLETQSLGVKLLHAVECKDQRAPIGPYHVVELQSRAADIKAHHAVLVSSSGFTEQGLKKAKALNVTAVTVADKSLSAHATSIPFSVVYFQWRCVIKSATLLNDGGQSVEIASRWEGELFPFLIQNYQHNLSEHVKRAMPPRTRCAVAVRIDFGPCASPLKLSKSFSVKLEIENVYQPKISTGTASGQVIYYWHDKRWILPNGRSMDCSCVFGFNDIDASDTNVEQYFSSPACVPFVVQVEPDARGPLCGGIQEEWSNWGLLTWDGDKGIPDYVNEFRRSAHRKTGGAAKVVVTDAFGAEVKRYNG